LAGIVGHDYFSKGGMMAFELNNGQGTIFKNKYKNSDKHPDYRGTIKTPSGEVLEIALWVKDGKNGKFFSASIQEPRAEKPKDYVDGAD
jgi:hypothetical protein